MEKSHFDVHNIIFFIYLHSLENTSLNNVNQFKTTSWFPLEQDKRFKEIEFSEFRKVFTKCKILKLSYTCL